MTSSALLAGLLAAICLAVGMLWSKRHRAGSSVLALPRELRKARLLFAERLFTVAGQVAISARVDRAYRVASGAIVLLELKTRDIDRPYWSDVIELSAQRAAVELQTGEMVADHAYVTVQRPGGVEPSVHRVQLMPVSKVAALAARREAILSGELSPSYARSAGVCRRCAFARSCEKISGKGGLHRTNATDVAPNAAHGSRPRQD